MNKLRALITIKYNLKIAAFILGCSFWYILSQSRPIQITYTVPLTFYGNHEMPTLDAPETITVALKASKADFNTINFNDLALHVNVDSLHSGKNVIEPNSQNLFLPPQIKLLHYNPSNVVVIVKNT